MPIRYHPGIVTAMDAYVENPRTNVLSIVSLVTSILGLAVVPVVLGHISLAQIRRTHEQGRVMAIIGLVIGYISVLGYLIALGIAVVILVGRGMSGA
jgi:hydrogenase-4 membrane subunit HyfE